MINRMDLHTHTIASGHAYSSLMDNVNTAKSKGVKIIGVSDHAPSMPGSTHEYYFSNLRVLPPYIEGVRVLKGAEVNVLNEMGDIDLDERSLSFLDYAIASLHLPCIEVKSAKANTDALINAMQHKIVKIIGHPDDSRYPLDYERLVLAAKENGVLLEVNNSSLSPHAFRENALENYHTLLVLCIKHEAMIIINSDCHFHEHIGDQTYALSLLEQMNFPERLIANLTMEAEISNWQSAFEIARG